MTVKTKMLLKLTGRKSFDVVSTTGQYVNGIWTQVEGDPFPVKGNEQPLPGYEIQMLPDSFRSKDLRKFFSLTFLNSLEDGQNIRPDKVIIEGVRFEVHKRKRYQMGPRNHYEYVLVREEQSAGGTN